jgi:enolase-phosphatase E1
MAQFEGIEAIVTDIEGTTSSIGFVKTVLFPYAENALPAFVRAHLSEPAVAAALDQTAAESGIARDDIDALIAQLLDWSRADRKITPLKTLQGLIWRTGYAQGDYRAHIYTDAAAQLRAWHAAGIPLYVYSSGSIAAQQLFFRYSEAGDLTALFSGHFDTTIGGKREVDSYRRIAQAIGREPQRLLFLSDVVEELDAAHAAGFQTCWLQRPEDGFAELQPHRVHPAVRRFDQIGLV